MLQLMLKLFKDYHYVCVLFLQTWNFKAHKAVRLTDALGSFVQTQLLRHSVLSNTMNWPRSAYNTQVQWDLEKMSTQC